MLIAFHVACALIAAGTLLLSGALKLRDAEGAAEGVAAFTVIPQRWRGPIARVLPYAEIALGALLVIAWSWAFTVVAALALLLFAGFLAVVVVTLRRGEAPACHCFGEATDEPISRGTVIRNALLVAVGVLALVLHVPFVGVIPGIGELSAAELLWALTTVVAVGVIAVLANRFASARSRLQRAEADRDAAVAERDEALARPMAPDIVPIPDAFVQRQDGEQVPLTDLVTEKAQLIFGVSPTCGACKDLAPLIVQWRQIFEREVTVSVISWAGWDETVAAYPDLANFLYVDPDGKAFGALGIAGTPGAVVLGLNGSVAAGPALGGESIVALTSALLQAIGVNTITGVNQDAQAQREPGGEDSGDAHLPAAGHVVTDVPVVTEDGAESTLLAEVARLAPAGDLPVVAWRDSCPYCAEIAPLVTQFSERKEVLLLINEPIETVRAQGLTGPVLQIAEGASAIESLQIPGTPAGYPITGSGEMQPGGGVGGGSVLRMLVERAEALGTFVEPEPVEEEQDHGHDHDGGEHNHVHLSNEVTPVGS